MRRRASLRALILCGITAFALPGLGDEEQCVEEDGTCEEAAPSEPEPAQPSAGVWSKWGDPVMTVPGIPLACRQKYVCSPPTEILSASGVHATPAEWVDGACAAGGGPVDDCNLCMTNEPTTPCEWWTEG